MRVVDGLKMGCIVVYESSRSRLMGSVMSRSPFDVSQMSYGRGFGNVMVELIRPLCFLQG